MRKIGRIISFILIIILLPYSFIIYFYPIVGDNIDEFIGTSINSSYRSNLVEFIGKLKGSKDSTNSFIDGIGSNTKSKTVERNKNIEDIINQ